MKDTTLTILAYNVRSHGGQNLLKSLIFNLINNIKVKIYYNSDFEIEDKLNKNLSLIKVKNNVLSKLYIEFLVWKNSTFEDITLCFGNLPPLLNLKGKTILYLQNIFILEKSNIKYRKTLYFKEFFLRLWFFNRITNCNKIFVQNFMMQNLLKKKNIKSEVVPFHDIVSLNQNTVSTNLKTKKFDFVYVSSGEVHKNHEKLIKSWVLLSKEGIRPNLALTVDKNKYKILISYIVKNTKLFNLNITNFGHLKSDNLLKLYQNSQALIYPSKKESLGLPLIEAKKLGLYIISSELDYVRDIIDPDQTFDPNSEISIKRAIKRHLNISENKAEILDTKFFLKKILK